MNCGAYICISMMLAGDPMPAEVQTITEGPGWISAAFSSDGKVIAAVEGRIPSGAARIQRGTLRFGMSSELTPIRSRREPRHL